MYLIEQFLFNLHYLCLQTISDKLLAECRSKTADIEVVRGYLEQEDCDVNIRENDEVCIYMVCVYTGF